ncbi:Ig-like domain-containing protein [Alloiococcus sp. CFN-8]|uniref:Ig-like domain-containing protein n=1 Tax=Alloiococcus sp. CFN-8 TaxID=3416081 RepID=UPI003CF2439B
MKNKFRIINILLILTLITSFLWTPKSFTMTAEAADKEFVTMTNPGFEDSSQGLIPGWIRLPEPTAADTSVEVSSEQAYEGNDSLKIVDNSTKASVGATSEFLEIEPSATYILRAKAYVAKASVRLYLKFFDSNKKEIANNGSYTVLANTLNQWSDAVIEGAAPANAVYAQVWFYMGAGGVSTAYVDNVSLEKVLLKEGNVKVEFGASKDLGEAVQVPLTQGAAYTKDSKGTNLQFFAINGSPATFYAVNAETGERVFSKALPGVDVVWAIDMGPDNNVYFSGTNDGKLYVYLTEEMRIEEYGPIADHKFIWDVETSEAGKVYMATYNKGTAGKVYEFDIASKTFRDLGGMKEGAEYVRGLGIDGNDLYAGVGGVTGSVIKYDLTTGEKEEITVAEPPTMFADVMVVQDKIIASIGTTVYVFDKATYEHLDTLTTDGKMISPPSPYNEDLVYYKANKTELYSYNVKTLESTLIEGIPPLPSTGLKDTTWVTLTQGEKAGKTVLATMGAYTDSVFYDPEDNWFEMHYPDVEAQGVLLQSLAISPEGQLNIGGYMRGASIYDTISEAYLHNMPTFHQPEGIGFMNGSTYFGTYTGGVIYRYNPDKPFNYREDSTGNPGIVYDIEDDQDRPFVIKNHENKLFIGTIPTYGKLGGALTIYEENEDGSLKDARVYTNIIEDQSIVGVAYKDGVVYVSSYIQGGLGSTPTADEAKIAMVDEATGKVLKEVYLEIPELTSKPTFIGDLSFGEDGLLWGVTGTDGTVFALNPDNLEVVKYERLYPGNTHANGFRPYYIRWGQDGYMYTNVSNKLIALDTETFEYKTLLSESVNLFDLDPVGNIYYGAATRLRKLPILLSSAALSGDKEVLNLGDTLNLELKTLLSNGVELSNEYLQVEYIIGDEGVVALKDGKLTALGTGETTIAMKVSYKGQELTTNTITVKVVIPVTGIALPDRKKNIKIGETYDLKAVVYPENATNKKVSYSSDNEKVAVVDSEGKVTALDKSSAKITVTTEDGSYTASMEIKVIGKPNK